MTQYVDDKILVKQMLAGKRHAFDRFFEDNFSRLFRFVLTRIPEDQDAAREIVQITMTKAIHKLKLYRAESMLFTWLCAICRNEISDWLKATGRRREHIVLVEDFPQVRAAVESMPSDPSSHPDARAQRAELARLIQVALDQLPSRYGDALEWKYVEGYTVKEIGDRMNLGPEAAQSLLARAKRAFREVYSALADSVVPRATSN